MKKIFIITGETSGDKLASKAIFELKNLNSEIEYLCVGGSYLKALKIKSIYDLKEITYLGFTKVFLNILSIKKKINETVDKIIEFNPDILFSVDSPDFTLRVAKLVKKNKPNIKTIHFVSPQFWVWRPGRIKKMKNFVDHVLLLFKFEKLFYDKKNIRSTFVGHPLLENKNPSKNEITPLTKDKKIISIFPGSRLSEINALMPSLIDFIKYANINFSNLSFVFHSTDDLKNSINKHLFNSNFNNYEVISNENIKNSILKKTSFAITKSGTISLEVCNAGIPSLIIYKMNFVNFFIIKLIIKVKFANIINIINNSEIIPELLQSNCNGKNIYNKFNSFMQNPALGDQQIINFNKVLKEIKLDVSSSEKVANILNDELKAFNS